MKNEKSMLEAARAGFTLVELLVVVAILGILGAVAVQNVIGHIDTTRKTAAKMGVDNIHSAIVTYKIAHKKLPSSLNDLVTSQGDEEPILQGGEGALLDPWDNEYQLKSVSGSSSRFYVLSAGPDGQEGTEDDIRSDKSDNKKK